MSLLLQPVKWRLLLAINQNKATLPFFFSTFRINFNCRSEVISVKCDNVITKPQLKEIQGTGLPPHTQTQVGLQSWASLQKNWMDFLTEASSEWMNQKRGTLHTPQCDRNHFPPSGQMNETSNGRGIQRQGHVEFVCRLAIVCVCVCVCVRERTYVWIVALILDQIKRCCGGLERVHHWGLFCALKQFVCRILEMNGN